MSKYRLKIPVSKPTLTDVFGANAVQTPTTLTISKSDLTAMGLTATSSNTAESLLIAIALNAKTILSNSNRLTNPDQKIAIDTGFDQIATRSGASYYQTTYNLTAQKVNPTTTIHADDY